MAVLLERGHSQSAVARLLGVSEGTVRYHRKRWSANAVDGRSQGYRIWIFCPPNENM